jgi:CRP-like cAMP-binding protein
MIVDQEQFRLLKKNTLLRGIQEEYLNSYLKPKNFLKFTEGEILYSTNEVSSEIYLVIDGEVKIKFNENKNIEFKIIFDFFGEAEILTRSKRISSAVANKNCTLYKMSTEELNQLSKTSNVILANLDKNDEREKNNTILNKTVDYDSILDGDNSSLDKEVIDFDQEKEDEVFNELSEKDLNDILQKQRSKHELDCDINEKENIKDEDSDDLPSEKSGSNEQ